MDIVISLGGLDVDYISNLPGEDPNYTHTEFSPPQTRIQVTPVNTNQAGSS